MEISIPIQLTGLALLVLFAGTFGARWAILAAALVLLFIGFVLSGVTLSVAIPRRQPKPAPGSQPEDHTWTS